MNESNSIDVTNTHLNDETLFRLNKISKIEDHFITEIKERKAMSKKLNKHIAAFDYTVKTLIALSTTGGGMPIISFTNVIWAPARIASGSFILIFSLTAGITKKLLKITGKKKKKHNKIVMPTRRK